MALRRTIALGAALVAAAVCHEATAGVVSIEVEGTLPGFTASALADFLVAQMNRVSLEGWHFAPAAGGPGEHADRVVWSFRPNPYAAGAVRSFGFSRGMIERLAGVHRSVTVEARLYLGGEYQTLAFGQVALSGADGDDALAREVVELSRALMAYPGIDAKPAPPGKRSADADATG